jgi:hypothetical protein
MEIFKRDCRRETCFAFGEAPVSAVGLQGTGVASGNFQVPLRIS